MSTRGTARLGVILRRILPAAESAAAVITAQGGTVTTAQKVELSHFIGKQQNSGRWPSIKRMYLPIWGVAGPNAVCIKSLLSGTWAGTVTHGAGYVAGNGSTGYLATGLTPAAAGITTTSLWLGFLRKATGLGSGTVIGSAGAAGVLPCRYTESGGSAFLDFTNYVGGRLANANLDTVAGIISARIVGTAKNTRARTAAGIVHSATGATSSLDTVNTVALHLLAENVNGTPSNFTTDEIGAAWIGLGVSDADDAAFTADLEILWESLTGLTLP